jgi:hypothetical protein
LNNKGNYKSQYRYLYRVHYFQSDAYNRNDKHPLYKQQYHGQ